MHLLLLTLWAAHADPVLDEAWYHWRTERAEAAMERAQAKLDATPDDLAWLDLAITAGVHSGDGARLENHYRERYADDPTNPAWRVALAQVIATRNTTDGAWCAEVDGLTHAISPTDNPTEAYYALKASILSHRVCAGSPEKDGADLRRAANATPLATADAAIERIGAGYIRADLPPQLADALDTSPLRLRDMEAAWANSLAGSHVGPLRRVVVTALRRQSTSDRPAEVWAAVEGWREYGNHRLKDKAAEHLRSLDAQVDPLSDRSPDTVSDPEIYATLDALHELPASVALEQLESMDLSDAVLAIQAHAETTRAALHEGLGSAGAAQVAHRRAWELTPSDRLYALRFARSAAATGADAEAALEALTILMANRTTHPLAQDPTSLDERRKRWTRRNLDLRAQIRSHSGDTAGAVADRLQLLWFAPTPAHHAALGQALSRDVPPEAGARDAAILHLATALAEGMEDNGATRAALEAAGGKAWHPRGLGALLVDASLPVDGAFAESPLVGEPWPGLEDGEVVDGPLELVAMVASWDPDTEGFLDTLVRTAADYGDAVAVRASSADIHSDAWSRWADGRDLPLDIEWVGPSGLRQLATVRLPTAALVAPDGTVLQVLRGWDADDTRLEDALAGALTE